MLRSRPPTARVLTDPDIAVRPLAAAVAAAVVVAVFWLPPILAAAPHWPRVAVGTALAAITGGAMVLRRRLPAPATTVVGAATIAGSVLGVCQDPMLGTAWCLYALAVSRASRTGTLAIVFAGLSTALAVVTAVPEGDASGVGQRLVVAVAALSVAWLLGTTVGRQIEAARRAERASVQLAAARELHDVVGHALGVIGAEAGVTRSLPDATERELLDSLADIESHARGALGEVQRLVRALRADPDSPAEEATVGLPQIPLLVATTRAAGVRVDARIDVTGDVDDAVGTAAFRIVQESLSNVVRHAPGAASTVEVRDESGNWAARNNRLIVRIRDDGPGADPAATPGSGLRGMRERARLSGGDLTWGNQPQGGFEVAATWPIRGAG